MQRKGVKLGTCLSYKPNLSTCKKSKPFRQFIFVAVFLSEFPSWELFHVYPIKRSRRYKIAEARAWKTTITILHECFFLLFKNRSRNCAQGHTDCDAISRSKASRVQRISSQTNVCCNEHTERRDSASNVQGKRPLPSCGRWPAASVSVEACVRTIERQRMVRTHGNRRQRQLSDFDVSAVFLPFTHSLHQQASVGSHRRHKKE